MLETLEKAFYVIGNKMINMSTGSDSLDSHEFHDAIITNELIIRPQSQKSIVVQTRETLNQLTKQRICDLAAEEFGAEFNFRTEKKQLISLYLLEQQT